MPIKRHAQPKRFIALPKWKWKELQPYNGFTHAERVRGWQIGKWLAWSGLRDEPVQCECCGALTGLSWHSEDYYDPFAAHAVCASCHKIIHQRFGNKDAFIELRNMAGFEDHWLKRVQLRPLDIAKRLREEGGPGVTDILARLLAGITLPADLHPPSANLLHPLEAA